MNFVWVYGREAHPEEHPFREGYESTDLGWEHPYDITETMEQRAQRARWLKTDPEPDYTIPMMIDYVGHPDQPDDAIRSSYRGAGFYAGFVIDCDGKVIRAHDWGWFAPGGEWWNLPLAPVDELHAFLDAYLADPPDCYREADQDAGVDDGGAADGDGDAAADDDEAEDGGASDDEPKDGGCSTSGGSASALLLLPGLLLAVRRRAMNA